jgi:DNA-binding NarL/FixJ family response regulator
MGSVTKIKILLVDDNRTFLSAVRNFLAMVPDVEVVAEAFDGAMALQQAAQYRPDLVLMDIAMPGMSGLEAASAMKAFARPPQIVFLSMHDDAYYRDAARELGALGFVGKSEFVDDLIPLITGLVSAMSVQNASALEVNRAAP